MYIYTHIYTYACKMLIYKIYILVKMFPSKDRVFVSFEKVCEEAHTNHNKLLPSFKNVLLLHDLCSNSSYDYNVGDCL